MSKEWLILWHHSSQVRKQAKTITKVPLYFNSAYSTFTVFSSEIQSGKSLTGANDETLFDNVEADCYWCLCKVLDTVQDHFTCSQPGIQRVCHRVNEVRFSLTFQCISPHLLHLLKACQSPWQSAFRASCERGIYLKAENAHWIPCDVLWQPNRVLTSFILHSDGRLACFFASSPAWHLPARWRVIMLSHFPSSSLYLVNSIFHLVGHIYFWRR